MTIDKKEVITLPKWLVILVLPMLISAMVAYGTISSWRGSADTKVERTQEDIQKLQDQKADQTEMNMIIESLRRIENKLDEHIAKK